LAALRLSNPLPILITRPDNYKPLNDAHGHEASDLRLREVANRLRGIVREMDLTARLREGMCSWQSFPISAAIAPRP
jgi:diguanylate cyclase (GGDEF)-like protein